MFMFIVKDLLRDDLLLRARKFERSNYAIGVQKRRRGERYRCDFGNATRYDHGGAPLNGNGSSGCCRRFFMFRRLLNCLFLTVQWIPSQLCDIVNGHAAAAAVSVSFARTRRREDGAKHRALVAETGH
jgi:hypothetical protein